MGQILTGILDDAREGVAQLNGAADIDPASLDDENKLAQTTFIALQLTERRRRSYRSVQAMLVAAISREQLWLAFPATYEYSEGFGTLKEFLRGAGVRGSALSDLNAIGTILVPYCDTHDIPIDQYLVEDQYPKLIEAISPLRRAIEGEENPGVIEAILADVALADKRDEIRAKYRRPTDDRLGRGTVAHQDGGAVMVLVIHDSDDIPAIVRKIAGTVEWDLHGSIEQRRGHLLVTVEDA